MQLGREPTSIHVQPHGANDIRCVHNHISFFVRETEKENVQADEAALGSSPSSRSEGAAGPIGRHFGVAAQIGRLALRT